MTAVLVWFRGRTMREQRLLLAMMVLFVITLVFAGIIRPVRDGLESTRQRHAAAEIRLGEIKAQVAQVKAIQRGRPRTPEGALADAIRTRADEAGFVLASLELDGDRIRIAIATARPGPLLSWIAGLEADGLLVDSSTVTGNGDGTVAATLTFKGRRP
ncbi:type II secretion system protein GspM [Sphingomonas mucosissima]|uniref:General secretion pathway, M protein n=1 Tax=Sphingomonas mucosissima TaxID=370959 RepID=A0A245ZRR3_9SPHN|nr:type II secretion system protein GspM [Sphingomonas mucosissima]OWK32416.1 general secretion pathway, M protein [Sphingomonas mucosissima]